MPTFVSNTIQVHIAINDPVTGQTMFLVLKRSDEKEVYPGLWQVVTGTLKEGESALMAALREVKEETNIVPKEMWTIPYVTTFFNPIKDHIHFSPVFGILIDDLSDFEISEEHSDYEWLDPEDTLERLVLPSHKEATKVFLEQIISKEDRSLYKINLDNNKK
jgi:dihydroneopterin triphosphate diphosphatase